MSHPGDIDYFIPFNSYKVIENHLQLKICNSTAIKSVLLTILLVQYASNKVIYYVVFHIRVDNNKKK